MSKPLLNQGAPAEVVKLAEMLMRNSKDDKNATVILDRLLNDPVMFEVWRTLKLRKGGDKTFVYPATIPPYFRDTEDDTGEKAQDTACALLFSVAFHTAGHKLHHHTQAGFEKEKRECSAAAASLRDMLPLLSRNSIAGEVELQRIAASLDKRATWLADPWGIEFVSKDTGDLDRRLVEDWLMRGLQEHFGCDLPGIADRMAAAALGWQPRGRARLQRRMQRAEVQT